MQSVGLLHILRSFSVQVPLPVNKLTDCAALCRYYSKIKSPMDLGTMKGKLDSGQYRAPEEFCEVRPLSRLWQHKENISHLSACRPAKSAENAHGTTSLHKRCCPSWALQVPLQLLLCHNFPLL